MTKGPIPHENLPILHVSAPNNWAKNHEAKNQQNWKEKSRYHSREKDKPTTAARTSTAFSVTDRTSKQKTDTDTEDWGSTIDRFDLTFREHANQQQQNIHQHRPILALKPAPVDFRGLKLYSACSLATMKSNQQLKFLNIQKLNNIILKNWQLKKPTKFTNCFELKHKNTKNSAPYSWGVWVLGVGPLKG